MIKYLDVQVVCTVVILKLQYLQDFFAAQIQRFNTFFLNNKKNSWPLNIDKVLELARSIDLNN